MTPLMSLATQINIAYVRESMIEQRAMNLEVAQGLCCESPWRCGLATAPGVFSPISPGF